MADDKPSLRGVSHHIAFYVAACAGVALVAAVHGARGKAATLVYAVLLAAMFGVSARYHRIDRSPRSDARWQRADHAMIFACIAGHYTPMCLLGLDPVVGPRLLALVWGCTGLGILRALLWPSAPRVVASALYVIVGSLMLVYLPEVIRTLDLTALALLAAAGVCYTAGAVVYAVRRPDPIPAVFGYHEVFHALVILACGCNFAAIARVALAH